MSIQEDNRFSSRMTPGGYHSQNQNVQTQASLDMSHSQSVNTLASIQDYIISEDLIAGRRLNGRMSNIRRFFCLFVTFDFLLIALMWLIRVMLNGQNIMQALREQIVHYDIHTSLFDIVLVAFSRFTVLLFFYAILYVNHWFVISISTSVTCAFLIAKVFVYDFPHSAQPIFEVLLVLASFILSWGEAWFLDFRVIPQEVNATRYLVPYLESERAPLVRNFINALPSVYTESNANFWSPLNTPEGSLYHCDEGPVVGRYLPVTFSKEQEDNYRVQAAKTLQAAWDLLHRNDWKFEKQHEEDCVYSLSLKDGKLFKLNARLNVPPRYLMEELYFHVQDVPKWHSAIKESYKIQAIDEYIDICYQISADDPFVTSRDFVNLRHRTYIDNTYFIATVSTEHPSLPASEKFVRAENGVGGTAIFEDPEDPNKCSIAWILNTKLKIKLVPRLIIEKELCSRMFGYVKDLRKHIESVRSNDK